MSLLVVGSIALDSVQTPYGTQKDILGGSATHFAFSASAFCNVKLVGVVGKDFPPSYRDLIAGKDVDISGLQTVDGKTFRWDGSYEGNMNEAKTLGVELNVLGECAPTIPENCRDSEYVFLANYSPDLQISVLDKMNNPKFVLADTMNLWIQNNKDDLLNLLKRIDGLILNDGESGLLTGEFNTIKAGRLIQEMGPEIVIIKKGEHGSILFNADEIYLLPAYPTEEVKDPTGAGDSFAGGVMGYIASKKEVSPESLKTALIYGTIMASFNIEGFGVDCINLTTFEKVQDRVKKF
ncbi:MAG: PfkB family carbohydrate kinase, partial [Candidatus Anammoxibacter sp.]